MSELIGKTIQQYRIERLLGQGGMAAVYAATDTNTQQAVAIKIMHRHLAQRQVFRDRFLQEANTAADLDHPNIVKVLNWGGTEEELLLVMQLVDGLNLRQYVRQLRDQSLIMPYAEAIEIIRQIADTLHYAHTTHNLIHRDIKPDNIILDHNIMDPRLGYRPMLTDFGLAYLVAPDDQVMMEHQPAGTYPYMSPEQTRGQGVDLRTDIYALGIMLYEVCTGHLPFSPKNLAEAAFMHGQQDVVPPSQLRENFPPQLEAIILKALAKNPDVRLQSAHDMSVALNAMLQPISLLSPEDSPVVIVADDDDEDTILETVEQEMLLAPTPPFDMPGRTTEIRNSNCLIFYTNEGSFLVPLHKEVTKVGRELNDDIRLKDPLITRNHLELERQPNGRYVLTDKGSTNGTWLVDDALEIGVSTLLAPYQFVRLGELWLQLVPAIDMSPKEIAAQDVLEDLALSTEVGEGQDTQLLGILPADAKPDMEPVQLSVEQLQNDRLIIYHAEDEPQIVPLTEKRYLIGSSPRRQIRLEGPYISRLHARIDRLPDGTYNIRDVRSTNGVWLGNQRLAKGEPTHMVGKQIFRIGTYWIKFEAKAVLGAVSDKEDEQAGDQIDTVPMIKPLDQEMPPISEPGISHEVRASDRLILFSEDHPLQIIPLNKQIMTLGRGSNQDIILRGKRVSRSHAVLELKRDGNIQYTDLSSTNGTWMGGTLLVANTDVLWQKNKIMRLGNYWMQFVRGEDVFLGATILNDRYRRVGKTITYFRIDRFIGENPLVALYKAYDTRSNEEVALRILHPEQARDATIKQRFLEEGRLLSRVVHPNVMRVLSFYDADNEVFMAAELISGGSLRQLMKRYHDEARFLEIDDVLKIALQIANGLHYAHQQGLIYRDLRPEGVVLRMLRNIGSIQDYQPVLTDFTLIRYADPGEIYEEGHGDDSYYAYMSPEQVSNRRIDIRSDIYELGVIFYELLCGIPPFQPNSIADAVHMHTREPVPDITKARPDIPVELEDLIKRSLEKNPDDRYQTAGAMARALQRVLEKSGGIDDASEALLFNTMHMEDQLPAEMPLRTEPPRTAEDLEQDRLIFYSERHPTMVVRMERDLYTVGRDETQDIRLQSQFTSRRHARIERGADGYYRILDIGSSNGSWLGTYRLLNNVAEIWETDETVRIGDYWVRIDRASDYQRATGMRAYMPGTIPNEFSTDPGDTQILERELEPERIQVKAENTRIEVAPGARAALPLEIINQDELVDHFMIEVQGLPSEWYTVPKESLYLLPLSRETASVEFHPPLKANASAGAHAFEIHVRSRARKINAVRTQGALIIQPIYNFKSELFPERIRGRGHAELFISNTGNIATTYSVQARDAEQAVRIQLEGRQYRLLPGEELLVGMQVQARKRIWFGSQQIYPFMVTVAPNPTSELSPPQTQNGELQVRPTCAVWMLGVLALLAVLIVAGALFGFTTISNYFNEQATATVVVKVTEAVETETAIAAEDSDGDGLSNALEAELGTFPNLADTDEDGLNDGEEIRIWNTEPLNRDTDGDNLSDGEEVYTTGTNPVNPDTDGDGIPDNMDINPLAPSTPTITPQPTIPGSAGDVCPGSPIPSRLAVGMRAQVEGGGVANRLRAEPNTDAEVITQMLPGSSFIILSGPECDDSLQLRWWEVDFDGETGWTAEGEEEEYYLCPPDDCEAAGGAGGAGGGSDRVAPDSVEQVSLTLPEPNTVAFDTSRMGVQLMANVTNGDWGSVLSLAQPLNLGWVKIQVNWRQLQPEGRDTRGADYNIVLSNIQDANARGFRVLVSVAKAPDWARSTTELNGPPDDVADLVAFVQMLLADAGTNISAIEVWNEPNLQREWSGTLPFNGGGYLQLFTPVYEQIQSQSPQLAVLTAGLAPTDTTNVSVNDRDFLWQMYDAGLSGLDNAMIGAHPFGWGNAPDALCCDPIDGRSWDDQPQFFFFNTLNAYHNIMNDNDDANKQIWATEFGWTTWDDLSAQAPEEWMNYITSSERGAYILRAFEIGHSFDFVGPMFLWNMNFADTLSVSNGDEMAGFSLLYRNEQNVYNPRSAYLALRDR
jgi:serine/threonine protein kinase